MSNIKVELLNAPACIKAIDKIKADGATLQASIHQVAVSTLAHTAQHGDYTLALSLVRALPNGQRVKALAHWFKAFSNGKLTIKLDTKKGWIGNLADGWTEGDFDVEGASAVTFADYSEEKSPETMTVAKLIAMLKRVASNEKETDGVARVAPEARALAARFVALAEA